MSDPMSDPTSDPRIERFFAAEGPWRAELAALRRLALAAPLEEAFKWRAPVYVAAGGNVATLGGLKDCCVLSFFHSLGRQRKGRGGEKAKEETAHSRLSSSTPSS